MIVTACRHEKSNHTSDSRESFAGLQADFHRENQCRNGDCRERKAMVIGANQDRGKINVDINECKGCALCMEACPPKVIAMSEQLNHYGYRVAMYAGSGCTGCGICFLACPEPGAITVSRLPAATSN